MLEQLLGSRVGVKLLMYMGRRPWAEWYLSELTQTLGLGLGRTSALLEQMARAGLLTRRRSGNRLMYRLNSASQLPLDVIHLAHRSALMAIAADFRGAVTRFASSCERLLGKNLLSVVVFGSVARGRARRGSDIDILVLVRRALSKTESAALRRTWSDVLDVFSKISEEHVWTEKEFLLAHRVGDDFLINVMRNGIIVVDAGDWFAKLLLNGIPPVTKEAIAKRLKLAGDQIAAAADEYKAHPAAAAAQLGIAVTHLARAWLLLQRVQPESKHELPVQLSRIGEDRFAKVYSKARGWWETLPVEVDRDEVWRVLVFLRNKWNESQRLLEGWT